MDAWNDDQEIALEDNQEREEHNFVIENASEGGGGEFEN